MHPYVLPHLGFETPSLLLLHMADELTHAGPSHVRLTASPTA